MILYELICTSAHQFEAWFSNSAAFDQQQGNNLISCPVCADHQIIKAPMAPRIGKNHSFQERDPSVATPKLPADIMPAPTLAAGEAVKMVAEFCKTIETNYDYVGPKFPEEARKIHYGEIDARGIYGEASQEEAVALKEEGIEVATIPWMRKSDA